MKFYISSKMTGLPQENFPAFFAFEKKMQNKGFDIVNPARISQTIQEIIPEATKRDYLSADLLELMECDGIIMFGDWRNSDGALMEHIVAKQLGMKIMYWEE